MADLIFEEPTKVTVNRAGYGNLQGFYSDNGLSPTDLYGYAGTMEQGIYYRMRFGNAPIKKHMDDRVKFLSSIPMEFAGPYGEVLNAWWKRFESNNSPTMKRFNLQGFLAFLLDDVSTYGFSLLEKSWVDDDLFIWAVDPITIYEFNQPDGKLDKPNTIRFWQGQPGQISVLDASGFYLINNPIYPGNFWGQSDLYPLIEDYMCLQVEYRIYGEARIIEKGILVAQETAAGSTVMSSNAIVEGMKTILKGQSPGLVLDQGWAVSVLQYNSGRDALGQFNTARDKFAEICKGYFDSNLTTLGLSTSGSRALGETFKIADQEKFEAFLESWFESFLASEFMADVCDQLGIPVDEVEITTPGIQSSSDRFDSDKVLALIKDGIVTMEQLGPENSRLLFESLGLNYDTMVRPALVEAAAETPTASSELSEELPFVTPQGASSVASKALLERSKRSGVEKGLSVKELDLAKKIAAREQLSPLDVQLLRAWFESNIDIQTQDDFKSEGVAYQEYMCLGGDEMRDSLLNFDKEDELEEEEEEIDESVMSAISNIDLKPTKGMIEAAKRGLALRREFNRGGTSVGVARARDISNGKNLSPETVSRMKSFHARHAQNEKAQGFESGEEGYPSAGLIAFLLWGGDPGRDWAERKYAEIQKAKG
jgi:hypothetical protein